MLSVSPFLSLHSQVRPPIPSNGTNRIAAQKGNKKDKDRPPKAAAPPQDLIRDILPSVRPYPAPSKGPIERASASQTHVLAFVEGHERETSSRCINICMPDVDREYRYVVLD